MCSDTKIASGGQHQSTAQGKPIKRRDEDLRQ
jgi:hypothetical protein